MRFSKALFLSVSFFFAVILSSAELIPMSLENAALKKYGPSSKKRFESLRYDILIKLKNSTTMKKLNVVNRWVNYIKYDSDISIYGVSDYWATLYEFIGKNRGDCEDYTIAKYYILKELGIDPKRMKFTYVVYKNPKGKRVSHMVLAYFKLPKPKSKKDILILDNNNRLILPASKRRDIVKVLKMINGDTGAKSKKWKQLEINMKRKKL
jgi:predicted transglutaminase-like cysteine proteinase